MLITHDKIYINGDWHSPAQATYVSVINSANEEVMASVCMCSELEVDQAVSAANAAFTSWSVLCSEDRRLYLAKAQKQLAEKFEEIALLIAQEVGTPLAVGRELQAGFPAAVAEMYVDLTDDVVEEQVANASITQEAIGVVACITPSNFPLHQIVAKVFPALSAGCTVILKPSELAPLTAFILAEIFDDVGLPAGVFNLVTGYGHDVGMALVAHENVDMMTFTGSTSAGKAISKLAANTLKRVSLELGVKSASIILADANLSEALSVSLQAGLLNSGQNCIAHARILVPSSLYEQAADILVSLVGQIPLINPLDEGEGLGPLISAAQKQRVLYYIQTGIEEGARLLVGGVEKPEGIDKGFYVKPTIFAEVNSSMIIAQEEIFGPVICLINYQDEADAIKIANDSVYGLSGAVWSKDVKRAKHVARQLRTGQVHINGSQLNPLAPFGGFKQSGNGRELGKYALQEFLEFKAIFN
jgi:betaine-aldehyde dehydrogenase